MSIQNPETYMRRALRLASLGRHASPNPMVGCVIVDSRGRVAGEGWHHAPGGPHAEVWALNAAGEHARGATVYVTLEPCSFFGRTPPCANALVDAGISRVVVAMLDPDARVSGRGVERLRSAGIEVEIGLAEHRARELNAAYIKHRTSGMPWVVLKTAMTLDGKIATVTGDSRWISSAISRAAVHRQLRDRCDAIISGVGSVIADDSRLTTRLSRGGRNPWRVIVDSRGRTPLDAQVVREAAADGRTIIATTSSAPESVLETFAHHGCQIIVCGSDCRGRVSLPDLLSRLGTRGDIISVLAETGAELSASLLEGGLVDRWITYVAPKVVGGTSAPGPIGGSGIGEMASALRVKDWTVQRCGPDVKIDAKLG